MYCLSGFIKKILRSLSLENNLARFFYTPWSISVSYKLNEHSFKGKGNFMKKMHKNKVEVITDLHSFFFLFMFSRKTNLLAMVSHMTLQ